MRTEWTEKEKMVLDMVANELYKCSFNDLSLEKEDIVFTYAAYTKKLIRREWE